MPGIDDISSLFKLAGHIESDWPISACIEIDWIWSIGYEAMSESDSGWNVLFALLS